MCKEKSASLLFEWYVYVDNTMRWFEMFIYELYILENIKPFINL